MGIPWGFPQDFAVGMGWVLKCNPHGSPGNLLHGNKDRNKRYNRRSSSVTFSQGFLIQSLKNIS